jgi:hypothetical protein
MLLLWLLLPRGIVAVEEDEPFLLEGGIGADERRELAMVAAAADDDEE